MKISVPSVRGRAGRALAGVLLGATILGGGFYASAQNPITPEPQTSTVGTQNALPGSFADLVAQVAPAVVSIQVTTESEAGEQMGGMPEGMPEFPPGSPFEHFFRDFRDQFGQGAQPHEVMGEGSGFIIDPSGYIVTNNHVAGDASEITVVLNDGTELPATLIGKDAATDLALIKVESDSPLPYLEFGDSDTVRVGDWVVSVGNPFGLGGTVTAGIVSALGRNINAGPYDDFMQIDAPINRGNSGGPTFDMHGRVIGINTAIFSPSGGSVGIGFAVPASTAKPILDQLRENGHVSRGWLGVHIQEVTPPIAEGLKLDHPEGALVAQVQPGSPAEAAGVHQGDVILSFDGQQIDKIRELSRVVAAHEHGKDVQMTVWRDGHQMDLTVTLGEMPTDQQMASAEPTAPAPQHAGNQVLGLELAQLDRKTRERFNIDESVQGILVIGVSDEASETDVRPGDVIVKVGDETVSEPAQLEDMVAKAKSEGRGSVLLLINRGGDERFVAMDLENA